ncbi:MAG: peptidylprolyl isomerase [Halanaerobiales bacterium]|nr:peptidylprolyl isomerase [Halanaerobiales bacterium]
MQLKRVLSIVMILTLLVAFPVAAQEGETTESDQPKVAAVVNGEDITMQELDQYSGTQNLIMSLYRSNPEFTQVLLQTEAGQNVIEEFQKVKLDQLITEKLLAQEANKRGIELSEEEQTEIFNKQLEGIKQQNNLNDEQLEQTLQQQGIESIDAYKQRFFDINKDRLIINKLQETVISEAEVTEEEMKTYYDENTSQFEVQEQVEASHILLKDEETAQEVLTELENGADFAELAKEYSTGPSAEDGGSLGYVSKDQNIAQGFKDALFKLEVGSISDVVETQYGFHIIKASDKKEAGTRSYDEVKEQIKQQLKNQKGQSIWEQFVRELRDEAQIEKKL